MSRTQPENTQVAQFEVAITGAGPGGIAIAHICMGAPRARLAIGTAINHLLDSAERIELAGPVAWTTTPSLSGPASVPLRIVRGPS